MQSKTFNLTLSSAVMIAPNVRHLVFELDNKALFDFIPGQFITFQIPSVEKVLKRSYSIASLPHQHFIEIAVSYVDGGRATAYFSALQPGDSVQASGPFGRLVLRDEQPKRYILVATGTGITPFRAMLPELEKKLAQQPDLEVVILAGARTREEILYANDFLEQHARVPRFKFYACISRETNLVLESHEEKGRVQTVLQALNLNPENDVIYLCGNPNMIDDCFEYAKSIGFNPQNVRREKYIST